MSKLKSLICLTCGYDKPTGYKYCFHCMVAALKYQIPDLEQKVRDHLAEELKKEYNVQIKDIRIHFIDNIYVEGVNGAYRVERVFYSSNQEIQNYFYYGSREIDKLPPNIASPIIL